MDIIVEAVDRLRLGDKLMPCAVGKGGFVSADKKREGDNKTPTGIYSLRACYWRPDKFSSPPVTKLPLIENMQNLGWCDDPKHPFYNRPVVLPFDASHEEMWRQDHCYDLVMPLGYNDAPPVTGMGSAIFFHLAKEGYSGTEGCVAVSLDDMLAILSQIDDTSNMVIQPQ